MKHAQKGFTLIEIMIVVAIIAILAAIAIPNFIQYRQTAQENACASNIKMLNGATEAWRIKTNAANDATPTMANLTGSSAGASDGFIKSVPTCGLSTGSYQWDSANNTWKHDHATATGTGSGS